MGSGKAGRFWTRWKPLKRSVKKNPWQVGVEDAIVKIRQARNAHFFWGKCVGIFGVGNYENLKVNTFDNRRFGTDETCSGWNQTLGSDWRCLEWNGSVRSMQSGVDSWILQLWQSLRTNWKLPRTLALALVFSVADSDISLYHVYISFFSFAPTRVLCKVLAWKSWRWMRIEVLSRTEPIILVIWLYMSYLPVWDLFRTSSNMCVSMLCRQDS